MTEPLEQKVIRGTHLADHRVWFGWDEERYQREKEAFADRCIEVLAQYAPGEAAAVLDNHLIEHCEQR